MPMIFMVCRMRIFSSNTCVGLAEKKNVICLHDFFLFDPDKRGACLYLKNSVFFLCDRSLRRPTTA